MRNRMILMRNGTVQMRNRMILMRNGAVLIRNRMILRACPILMRNRRKNARHL